MASAAVKTLADDFNERVTKELRPKFTEHVIPSHMIDYLSCLDRIDEEIVKAQEKLYGSTYAAGVLFERLIRRPNWFEDLIETLRNSDVGLEFLADEFEQMILTVPARWNIVGFTDSSGEVCFDGNCIENDNETRVKEIDDIVNPGLGQGKNICTNVENVPSSSDANESATCRKRAISDDVNDTSSKSPKMKMLKEDIIVKEAKSDDRDDNHSNSPKLEMLKEGLSVSKDIQSSAGGVVEKSADAESLTEKREKIRVNMMEKIFAFVNVPADVPIAIRYVEKLNKVTKGSIMFYINIGSFEELEKFEKLWNYGGLKRLLDRELLNEEMIQMLEKTTHDLEHPVTHIRSDLQVFDTDIQRCRSWLTRKSIDVRPHDFADPSLQMLTRNGAKQMSAGAKYVLDRLPEEIQLLVEDPLLSNTIHSFYESQQILRKIENEHKGINSDKSVLDLFSQWFDQEMSNYLKSEMKAESFSSLDLILVSAYLIDQVRSELPIILSREILSDSFAMSEKFLTRKRKEDERQNSLNVCCFDLITIPEAIELSKDHVQKAVNSLTGSQILRQSRGKLDFHSKVLRDFFITNILLTDGEETAGEIERYAHEFGHLQTIVGLLQNHVKGRVDEKKWLALKNYAFKTVELRQITNVDAACVEMQLNSDFVVEDLLSNKDVRLLVPDNFSPKLNRHDAVVSDKKRKLKTIDLTKMQKYTKLPLTEVLAVINKHEYLLDYLFNSKDTVRQLTPDGYRLSIYAHDLALNERNVREIGEYLNVTPAVYKLCMTNCQLQSRQLRNALQTGHFRNISYLNISDNTRLRETSEPFGFRYMLELKILELQNCNLGDSGISLLAKDLQHLSKLREINVANNQMTDSGLLELSKSLASCKGLTCLRLQKNALGKAGVFVLASWLRELIVLEVLNIGECSISDNGASLVAGAIVSRSLKKLSMRNNRFTGRGSRDFFQYMHRPRTLEHLDFGNNNMTRVVTPNASSEPFLDFLQHKAPISYLSLWKCGLGENRIFLDHSKYESFRELKYLCLQENEIADDFATDIAVCIQKHSNYLEHLNLRENNIGTHGALKLADALRTQNFIKEVFLDRNMIRDKGAREILTACISKPSISIVDLSFNTISRDTIETIVQHEDTSEEARQILTGRYAVPVVERISGGFDDNKFIVQKEGGKLVASTYWGDICLKMENVQ